MSETYIHYGSEHFDISKFEPIKNIGGVGGREVKPSGGLWASFYDDSEDKYDWENFCIENDFNLDKTKTSFSFNLKKNSKVLLIDDIQKLKKLQSDGYTRDMDERFAHLFHDLYCLDFEKLVDDGYDAIKVFIRSNDIYYALYGWDIDSLLVLNPDCISEINC